jgi:FtsX-like permease family
MEAAWSWAQAEWRTGWRSLAAVAVLIGLVTGGVMAFVAGARRAGSSVDRFSASTQLAEVVAFIEEESPGLLDQLAADPRIADVGRSTAITAAPDPVEVGQGGYMLIGADDDAPGGIGRPMLLAGRYPAPGSTDEMLVNETAADMHGFRPGDRATVHALRSIEDFDTERIGEAVVVGVVRLPFDLADDPSVDSLALAGPSFLDGAWRSVGGVGQILWLRLHDPADAPALISELSRQIDRGDAQSSAGLLGGAQRATELQWRALLVAAGILAAAGVAIVTQAIGRHLARRSTDVRVLVAIGLTRADRTRAATATMAPALVAGAVLGAVLAALASPLLPLGVARRADPDLGLHIDWVVVFPGMVASLLVTSLVTGAVARRWGSAREAPVAARPSIVARVGAMVGLRPAPSAGSQLALASGHGPARLPVVQTVGALVGASAVVAGSLVVLASLDGLVGTAERYGQPWDVAVDAAPDEQREVGSRLSADPRVEGADLAHRGEIDLVAASGETRQVGAVGLEGATGPMWLAVLAGRSPPGPGEIALGSSTMRDLGLDIGQTTTISGPCGTRSVEVVGRAIVPLIFDDDPDTGLVLPLATFDELCAEQLIAEIDETVGVLVRLEDGESAEAFVESMAAEQRYAAPIAAVPSSVNTLGDVRQVPLLVAITVGLLGALAGAHALLLAVRRRHGDLAVLRALGMRPAEVRRVIRWQALTLGLAAVGLGLPAGVVAGRAVWRAIAEPANLLVRIDVDMWWLGSLAIGTIAVLVAAAVWPSLRAGRLRPAQALRSE